jgi:hypothetical protein
MTVAASISIRAGQHLWSEVMSDVAAEQALAGDVVILGGGLVGMTLAIGLRQAGPVQPGGRFLRSGGADRRPPPAISTNLGMAERCPRAARSMPLP